MAAKPKLKAEPKAEPAPKPVAAAPAPQPAAAPVLPAFAAPVADQVKLSPIGGSEISIDKVSNGVATVSQADIVRQGAPSVQEVLQAKVPGVTLNDLQGSGFQTDIQYRGFQASPVDGVAQGLAVYQNGVRINEAFGDTVNLDLIPQNAIADLTVMPSNPAFGLNALGGSLSIGMKDGFNTHGTEIDARLGSFGRRQFALSTGQQAGPAAIFAAYEDITDNGWRDFSPSHIRRFYGDIGIKSGDNELHFNLTRSDNFYGVVAASPVELLSQGGWGRTYTSPQTTENTVTMPTVNATVKLDPATKLSGVAYYRNFSQRHVDGNPTNASDCGGTFLCNDNGDHLLDQNGNFISADNNGEIDRTRVDSDSWGASAQVVNKAKLFGHANQFLVGTSYDHGTTSYQTSAELGTVDPANFFVTGSGQFAQSPNDFAPRNVRGTNDYYGIFLSDAFDVTDALTMTAGGRYNYAEIKLQDLTGQFPSINGQNIYERFNPSIGATYKLTPGFTLYGGYSEANRAPTVAELACADPNNSCVISSFLTSDPPLKQVVAHTFEAGVRGELKSFDARQRFDWSVGLFRTLSSDDILAVSVNQSQGFFQNAGDTLRQGVEVAGTYRDERLMVYGAYNYVDATFQSTFTLPSPNNPQNPSPGDPYFITVNPGNHLPNVPQHKFKAGMDYWMTPQWKLGGDMVAATDSFFRGDESNQNTKLGGYAVFNLHTSYDLSKNFQLYGLINNLFDARYGTYGVYYSTTDASSLGSPYSFTDPRAITPATPFAAYGGMKVRF